MGSAKCLQHLSVVRSLVRLLHVVLAGNLLVRMAQLGCRGSNALGVGQDRSD